MFPKPYRGLKREERVVLESESRMKGEKKKFCRKYYRKANPMLSLRIHLKKGEWCLTSFLTKGSSLSKRRNWFVKKERNGVAFLSHRSITKVLSWWLSSGPFNKPDAVLTLKVLFKQARRGFQTCWLSRRMFSEADYIRF